MAHTAAVRSAPDATEEKTVGAVVRVRQLKKSFVRSGGELVRAIDDVSFDIPRGEFTVLLGPSGCGKTTLLRAIAGLETPDSGLIELNGKPAFSSAARLNLPPEKRHISMVFQSYALWPHMTVFDNVAYPLRSRGRKRLSKSEVGDKVADVLRLVGIPSLGSQYPGQMSGGQQQRVALARALATGSDLILFDEPLSNVDAKVREELRVELLAMQEALGFAAVFVTHDQVEAMVLADRIAVLDRGQIVQFGSPQEIYNEPRTRYVANFIGTSNELAGIVRSVSSGGVEVTTAMGVVNAVPGTPGIAADDEVVAMWRPELLTVTTDEPDTANRWQGTVEATLFVGSHTEYVVAVGDERFRAWSPQIVMREVHETVWVSVAPENVRALPADPE